MPARSFYTGAKALEQLGKPEQSLNWAQRAASLDPGYADGWYLLARLYRKLGQDEKAPEAGAAFGGEGERTEGCRVFALTPNRLAECLLEARGMQFVQ